MTDCKEVPLPQVAWTTPEQITWNLISGSWTALKGNFQENKICVERVGLTYGKKNLEFLVYKRGLFGYIIGTTRG